MWAWKNRDTLYLSVRLAGRKRARKEGIETFVWLEVRSDPLDECGGVSLLPVTFISALLFDAPPSTHSCVIWLPEEFSFLLWLTKIPLLKSFCLMPDLSVSVSLSTYDTSILVSPWAASVILAVSLGLLLELFLRLQTRPLHKRQSLNTVFYLHWLSSTATASCLLAVLRQRCAQEEQEEEETFITAWQHQPILCFHMRSDMWKRTESIWSVSWWRAQMSPE